MNARISRKRFLEWLAATTAYVGVRPLVALAKPYTDTTSWDPFVPEIKDSATYLRRKFRQDVTDKATGLDIDGLKKLLGEIVAAGKATKENWRVTKAKCFAAQVERMAIDVSPLDWFPAISVWNRWKRPITNVYWGHASELNEKVIPAEVRKEWDEGYERGDWAIWQDFDHSIPDWRVVLPLGYPGLKARFEKIARERSEKRSRNEVEVGERSRGEVKVNGGGYSDPFDEGLRIAMEAILKGIDRFIAQGEKRLACCRGLVVGAEEKTTSAQQQAGRAVADGAGRADGVGVERLEKEIASLKRLRTGAPVTAYDFMMFVWLYFFYSEHLDGIQCRSLTELDVFLTPYYEADLKAGRTTEAEFREQLKHFLWQWGSISNYWNQPVGFGGTNPDGTSAFNHVSKIILDVVDECDLTTPKFLVKVSSNTPDWAWDKMLDMSRRHRSLSYTGEEAAAKALKKWCGASDEDCREMVMTGCYEFSLRDAANGSGAGHVNMLKPVEDMLVDATGQGARQGQGERSRSTADGSPSTSTFNLQPPTFESFKKSYLKRLADLTARCRKIALWTEKVITMDVNPAHLMTLSTEHALRNRLDGYANGCPRGNNSAILSVGLGTTVDALLAVKEIVYEKKEMTLAELGKVMAENWKGHEALRLRMLRSKRKWGNNDPEANALGGEIVKTYAAQINGFPNARGGKFLASGHCARQYIHLGEKTGATPDGRKAGEEMSKNLSPTMGADTEGTTALVMTFANSGTSSVDLPGDYPLDVMMHPSACEGERGLRAMRTIVKLFHKNGGCVVQFTVFSPEELKDAQAHPEKYENLQVRVCGWNVRWNDLCKAEQDAYIRRAECIMR